MYISHEWLFYYLQPFIYGIESNAHFLAIDAYVAIIFIAYISIKRHFKVVMLLELSKLLLLEKGQEYVFVTLTLITSIQILISDEKYLRR